MLKTTGDSSLRICTLPMFDPKDFSRRWERARLSALQSVLAGATEPERFDSQNKTDNFRSEVEQLKNVPEGLQEQVLRRVFDYSRKLGISVSRHLNLHFEISDFAELLAQSDSPCFQGAWKVHNSAQVLHRNGCALAAFKKSFFCDYWREALDGLIMGAGDCERLARHRSVGHGDVECVDVLFTESFAVPRIVSSKNQETTSIRSAEKLGPVPTEISQGLEEVSKRFDAMRIKLHVDGLSEGSLYYRLETEEGVLCGAGGKLLHDSFHKALAKKFPNLIAKDAAPLAVYGGAT